MPTSLSWAREAAIHGRYDAERLRLVAEEQKHRAGAERRQAIIRAKWAATRQSIEADISATRGLASDLRADLDARLRAAHQVQAEAAQRLDAARRHLRNAAS